MNDKKVTNKKRPVKPSEKKIDRFLSDLETEEGAKRWGNEAFKESKSNLAEEKNKRKLIHARTVCIFSCWA